ncbi:MAG: hypothetical protein PHW74_14770 [Desulfobacca sp.]|nr:hypothetical protein [Desulfobacca sp.]
MAAPRCQAARGEHKLQMMAQDADNRGNGRAQALVQPSRKGHQTMAKGGFRQGIGHWAGPKASRNPDNQARVDVPAAA